MAFLGIGSDPKHFKIGDVEFVKLVGLSESSHLEKNETEDVCDGVNVVAWLYDSKQASDYHNWHKNITKAQKLKEFDQLYRSKKIHKIEHKYLKEISFFFGKIIERTIDIQEDLIVVTMKIKHFETPQEKEIKRDPPKLADAKDSDQTKTASTLKSNQAEEEAAKTNTILQKIDNLLSGLWD